MNTPRSTPPLLVVFWSIWFAITSSVVVMQFVVGGGFPEGKNEPGVPVSPLVYLAIGEVLAATIIRWLILPKFTQTPQQLVTMIIGLALAEAAGILGLFLVPPSQPETRQMIFILSLLGVLQFAPIFVKSPGRDSNPFLGNTNGDSGAGR